MPRLEVVPAALASAAAAVRCFSHDLLPVTVADAALGDSATAFSRRWADALQVLSADADGTALSLREAADGYVRVDSGR